MSSDNIDIKKLTAQDLDQYNGLLRYAFQVTEKTLLESGWEDEDIKQSKFPVLERANVWGCFDEGELVSQFAVYPLDMNIHSVVYPMKDRAAGVARILELPEQAVPLNVLPVGYPQREPHVIDKWDEKKIHREKW